MYQYDTIHVANNIISLNNHFVKLYYDICCSIFTLSISRIVRFNIVKDDVPYIYFIYYIAMIKCMFVAVLSNCSYTY